MYLIGIQEALREEYIQYWQEQDEVPCVGLAIIKGRYWNRSISSVHCDGTSRGVSWVWYCIPTRYLTYNRRGICMQFSLK